MKNEQEPEVIGTEDFYENIPRKRFFLGCQGKQLTTQVAIAGSIGFLLFGYDQGVLGWAESLLVWMSTANDVRGLNASENFLQEFNNPSSSLLGTINAIYT
jgi:hypothetical protein